MLATGTRLRTHEIYNTLSQFFRDVLELSEYEREAIAVTGAVSPLVVDRLAATLLAIAKSPSGHDIIAPFRHTMTLRLYAPRRTRDVARRTAGVTNRMVFALGLPKHC